MDVYLGLHLRPRGAESPEHAFGAAAIAGALLLSCRFKPATLIVAGLLAGIAPAAIRNVVVAQQ